MFRPDPKPTPVIKAKNPFKRKATPEPSGDFEFFKSLNLNQTCKGCGVYIEVMKVENYSHIIKKGVARELRFDPANVTTHCIDCHTKWEYAPLEKKMKMLDFDDNLKYIYLKRKKLFERIFYQIKEQFGYEYKVQL